MVAIPIPKAKNPKFLEPSVQATQKDKQILEGRRIIYNAFLDTFGNLEEETKREIEKLKKPPKQKTQESQGYLKKSLRELQERLHRLENEDEKKIFTFILKNHENIFNNVDQERIKGLSEESFHKLLLSVYEKIREENLADEKNLTNGEIKVDKRIDEIRDTDTKDWIIGRIKSKTKELLGKIPGLGKFLGDEEKKEKKSLSDKQMARKFLRKIFLHIFISVISILISGLIFGVSLLTIVAAVAGALWAIKTGVWVLFSNDKKGTLYNTNSEGRCFSSHDKGIVAKSADDAAEHEQDKNQEKEKEWSERFSKGISDILQTPVGQAIVTQPTAPLEEDLTNQPAPTNSVPTKWQQSEGNRRKNSTDVTNSVPM